MSVPVEYVMRRFLWYGAEKYGLAGKLSRLERLLLNPRRYGRCVSSDVLGHYIDAVIIKLLNNMDRSLRIKNGRELLVDTDDVDDPVVQQNYMILPALFGYEIYLCEVTGGTCASNAVYPCGNLYMINGAPMCCTSTPTSFGGFYIYMVDNPPFITNYSVFIGGSYSWQYPTTPGVVTVNFNFTGPSCFPSGGTVLQGPVIASPWRHQPGGTCASSCPSGSVCGTVTAHACPSSTYTSYDAPMIYLTASVTVLPNTTYSGWIKFQFA